MLRVTVCLVAALLVAETPSVASAQTTTPAQTTAPAATTAPTAAKPSRIRLTVERLKEMRARWVQNKPKLKACRTEMKSKGITGDHRWFFMEDCMGRT
jgi:tRNA(Ile2) C34 agmatinyltransferase TiaS